jgi:hypothetical protein
MPSSSIALACTICVDARARDDIPCVTASPDPGSIEEEMADSARDPAVAPVRVPAGQWVEIERVVLPAADRARTIPPDTAATDFVARVRGFLAAEAEVGATAMVKTLLDRDVGGRLVAVNPRNPANFGDPVPELLRLGLEASRSLEESSSR